TLGLADAAAVIRFGRTGVALDRLRIPTRPWIHSSDGNPRGGRGATVATARAGPASPTTARARRRTRPWNAPAPARGPSASARPRCGPRARPRKPRGNAGRAVHPGGVGREPERVLEPARAGRRQPDGPALRLRPDPAELDKPRVDGGAERAGQVMALLAPVDAVAH